MRIKLELTGIPVSQLRDRIHAVSFIINNDNTAAFDDDRIGTTGQSLGNTLRTTRGNEQGGTDGWGHGCSLSFLLVVGNGTLPEPGIAPDDQNAPARASQARTPDIVTADRTADGKKALVKIKRLAEKHEARLAIVLGPSRYKQLTQALHKFG